MRIIAGWVLALVLIVGAGASIEAAVGGNAVPGRTSATSEPSEPAFRQQSTTTTSRTPPTATTTTQPGGPAPAYDLVDDASFIDRVHGWAVAQLCSSSTCRLRIAVTGDGGERWRPLPAVISTFPNNNYVGTSIQLTFASSRNGIVFAGGAKVFMTRDGGSSWQDEIAPGLVDYVVPADGGFWALLQTCSTRQPESLLPPGTDCYQPGPPRLFDVPPGGGPWTPVKGFPVISGFPGPLESKGTTAIAVAFVGEGVGSRSILITTTDGGTTWRILRAPCDGRPWGEFAQGDPLGELWLLCGGVEGVGAGAKQLWRSADGGERWVLESSGGFNYPTVGLMTVGGYIEIAGDVFAVTSGAGAVFVMRRSNPAFTTDGGRSWRIASTSWAGGSNSDASSSVEFVNDRDGWYAGGTTVFRTIDGGHSWQGVQITW